jgi:hypothetical protein
MKPTGAATDARLEQPAILTRAITSGLVWGAISLAAVASFPKHALADEGGVSFWIPGFFGSLAAAPQQPGWSVAAINYYTNVSAGGNVALAREFAIRNLPANIQAQINASLHANADIGFVAPSYVFATPVLGGQASVTLLEGYGVSNASLNGTVSGSVTGPLGNSIPFGPRFDSINSSVTGFTDLIPQAALRWNAGVDNYMVYATGDIPIGAYNSSRLANLGIGHGAFDAGAGYTYFNPQTGHEFSGVLGFTANFINPATQYQNGVDMRVAIPVQAVPGWRGRLCLQGHRLRQRLRRSRRLLPVAGVGRWPADRLHFSDRRHAGLSQSESLRGIRRVGSAYRLECVAHAFDLAAGAYPARIGATHHHQVAAGFDYCPESPLRWRDLISERHRCRWKRETISNGLKSYFPHYKNLYPC